MKLIRIVFLLTVVLLAGPLSRTRPVSADTEPSLAPILIGNWQYHHGNAVMGTVRFDGLTAGTIYDNRYGTAYFEGKFASRNVFEGYARYPGAKPGVVNIVFDFYHPQNNPKTWLFKGWVKDYTNGSFFNGQKL